MSRTVKLRFHGLMFFHFDDDKKCRIGIHTKAKHHKIIIRVGKEEGDEVKGIDCVIPTDIARAVKHLWLYVTEVANQEQLPQATRISIESSEDDNIEKVMDMRECYKLRDPLKPRWDDVLTPSLHITTGTFFSRTVTDECKLVKEEAVANLFFAIFQPTSDKLDEKFDSAKNEYGTNYSKTLAEIIGVNITVEDNQLLVLAIGDENGPTRVLSSILPENGLAILIANLPPRRALLPKDFNHVGHGDKEDDGEEETNDPSLTTDIETQIRNRLRHSFHFLHYYDAFENIPDHKRVLLGKTDKLDDRAITLGVRPDPPCIAVRDSLPVMKESVPSDKEGSATPAPKVKRSE